MTNQLIVSGRPHYFAVILRQSCHPLLHPWVSFALYTVQTQRYHKAEIRMQ